MYFFFKSLNPTFIESSFKDNNDRSRRQVGWLQFPSSRVVSGLFVKQPCTRTGTPPNTIDHNKVGENFAYRTLAPCEPLSKKHSRRQEEELWNRTAINVHVFRGVCRMLVWGKILAQEKGARRKTHTPRIRKCFRSDLPLEGCFGFLAELQTNELWRKDIERGGSITSGSTTFYIFFSKLKKLLNSLEKKLSSRF